MKDIIEQEAKELAATAKAMAHNQEKCEHPNWVGSAGNTRCADCGEPTNPSLHPHTDWEKRWKKGTWTIEVENDPSIGDGGTHLEMDYDRVESFIHQEISHAVAERTRKIKRWVKQNKGKDPMFVGNLLWFISSLTQETVERKEWV